MLVSTRHKRLVLNLSNPSRVRSVIASAGEFDYRGESLVHVPHAVGETRLLRMLLGADVPSPIKFYYGWPRANPAIFNPFGAQIETAAFVTLNDRGYVHNDMGTGKTLACLWGYDYMREEGYAQKVIVSAPLSALERAWGDEVFKHFPHLTAGVLHGSRQKRWKLLDQDYDIYVVNHDGMEVIADALKDRPDISHVFVDEVATLRNARTDRWKAHNVVINKQHPRSAIGITGTPVPNSPEDAFGQVKLITPGNITPYFGQFRDDVMRKVYPVANRRGACCETGEERVADVARLAHCGAGQSDRAREGNVEGGVKNVEGGH